MYRNRAKIPWDLQIQTDTQVIARHHGDRQATEEGSTDRCSNPKRPKDQKKTHKKLWSVKISVDIEALGAVALAKLEKWLQQIPGTKSEILVQ